jgi:phage repressor protein C with HTH and peptisase S24 domain
MTSKATKTFRQFLQGTTLSQEEWEEEVYGPKEIDETLKMINKPSDERIKDQEKRIQYFKNRK